MREITTFVERERGLRFKRPPRVRVTRDFDVNASTEPAKDARRRREAEKGEVAFKAVGLLSPQDDLYTLMRSYASGHAGGKYDPKTGTLIIPWAGTVTASMRVTIAHELTHALDDQHFDLNRPRLDRSRDETGIAFRTLVEGSAVRVERLYYMSLPSADRAAVDRDRDRGADAFQRRFSRFMHDYMSAPYGYGPRLVGALLDSGGTAALDEAFRAPPTSTEQLIFPERFIGGDWPKPVPVPAPAAGGRPLARGSFGAELVAYLVESARGVEAAGRAAKGWGGGLYVTWRDRAARPCLRATLSGDTAADARELRDGLEAWAAGRPHTALATAGDQIVLTACGEESH